LKVTSNFSFFFSFFLLVVLTQSDHTGGENDGGQPEQSDGPSGNTPLPYMIITKEFNTPVGGSKIKITGTNFGAVSGDGLEVDFLFCTVIDEDAMRNGLPPCTFDEAGTSTTSVPCTSPTWVSKTEINCITPAPPSTIGKYPNLGDVRIRVTVKQSDASFKKSLIIDANAENNAKWSYTVSFFEVFFFNMKRSIHSLVISDRCFFGVVILKSLL
jgi:hypothetical protein